MVWANLFLHAKNPLIFRAARAFLIAWIQGPMVWANLFLARRLCFLLTILPLLFWSKSAFLRPPTVLSLVPLKTVNFARLLLATLLTIFFFMAFMAFMAFIAFIAFAMLVRSLLHNGKV